MGGVRKGTSDAELVARVAAGFGEDGSVHEPGRNGALAGQEALRELLERHGPSVTAMAVRMLGSREEAEEVLQDTFMRLYRHAGEFRPGTASLRTWLFTVARNLCTSRIRKRYARPKAAPGVDPHSEPFQASVGMSDDPLPGILVRDALAHLEADERDLLDGAFYLGYSHSELAEQNGLALGTVKSRVRRALLKLRSLLDERAV